MRFARPRAAAAALTLALVLPFGHALAQDKVIATIDGQPITDEDLTIVMNDLDAQLQRLPEPSRRRIALDRLVDLRIVAAAAARDGLDKEQSYLRRLEGLKTQLLVGEYLRKKIEATITEEVLKARYDKDVKNIEPQDEVRARHILVEKKEEAEEIIKALASGGDFAAIAKEKSKDPGSAENGGDLGYFTQGQMVKEFDEAAFKLKPGEVAPEPIQTQFGFHVLKVEDRRKQALPSFEDVKAEVRQIVFTEKVREALTNLKGAAKVEIVDPALKAPEQPAAPAAPAPAAPAPKP